MGKRKAIALGCVLALAVIAPASAQEADVDLSVYPVEVRIDILRALIARAALIREMSRLPTIEGEAVLGEEARREAVADEAMLEMLGQLKARAAMSDTMGNLPKGVE